MNRLSWILLASFVSTALLVACSDTPDPSFECNCTSDQVCRDGICIARDAGIASDVPDEFIDNPDCPASGIVINELLPAPDSGDPEFVEITGPTGADLTSFRLVVINGNGGGEEMNVRLEGGTGEDGMFLIATTALSGADQLNAELVMQNGPDTVQLLDCGGQVVDAVGYGEFTEEVVFAGEGIPAPNPGTGRSLGRCPGDTVDAGDNFNDFHIIAAPTPGEENDFFLDPFDCIPCEAEQFHGAVVINEVLANPTGADAVENEFVELRGPADMDLVGLELVLLDGNSGNAYESMNIMGSMNSDGFHLVGGPMPDTVLSETLQNGPDGVVLFDCNGSVVDALSYGDTSSAPVEIGEGDGSIIASEGDSLARCPGGVDNDNNAADFNSAAPSPGLPNADFIDARACGGTGCPPGVLDDRLHINEVFTGSNGFVELQGDPILGLVDVTADVLDGAGELLATLTFGAATTAQGFAVADTAVIVADSGSIVLYDCNYETLDALAWGDGAGLFGEGSPLPRPAGDQGLARCPDGFDVGNNVEDYHLVTTPTPGEDNAGFVDPTACDIPDCEPGRLTGNVLINELAYAPDGPDGEGPTFIELRGAPGTVVHGAKLVERSGSDGASSDLVELVGVIPGSGYFVVGQNLDVSVNMGADTDLTNTRGGVDLLDCEGVLIDAMAYGDDAVDEIGEGNPSDNVADNNDESLARCTTEVLVDADTNDNYVDFHRSTTPSPGAANYGFVPRPSGDARPECPAVCIPDLLHGRVVINEVVGGAGGFVELMGGPGLPLLDVTIRVLDGFGSKIVDLAADDADTAIAANGFVVLDADQIPGAGGTVLALDCDSGRFDALAWGTGSDLHGEGDAAAGWGEGTVGLARCRSFEDSDDNADDFRLITAGSPDAANSNFEDLAACRPPASPLAGQIVINEISTDPPGTDGDGPTFIELRGAADYSLAGLDLFELHPSTAEIEASLALTGSTGASGLYLVGRNTALIDQSSAFADGIRNAGGVIVLADNDGRPIDSVAWGNAELGIGEGTVGATIDGNAGLSLARCSGTIDSIDSDDNGIDFRVDDSPTPGTENDVSCD